MPTAVTTVDPARCKNCEAAVERAFCATCGQKTSTARIDLEGFIEELLEVTLHSTGRLFHTFREMSLRPGESIAAYLAGKRKTYQDPISYFAFGYLAIEVFAYYVLERWELPVGTITKLGRTGVFVSMAFDAVSSHFLVVRPRLSLMETLVIFVYVYGTMFFHGVVLMSVLVLAHEQLPALSERVGGMIVDLPLIAILCFYFIRIARFLELNVARLMLGLVLGVGTYFFVREVLGIK